MSEKVSSEEILARNPQIDRDQFVEIREILRRLREMGLPRKGYDLVSPYRGRRGLEQEDGVEDPRLVRLGQPATLE